MSDLPTRAEVLDAYRHLPTRADASAVRLPTDAIACGDKSLLEVTQALGQSLGRPVVPADIADCWLPTTLGLTSVLLFACRRSFSAEAGRKWVASSLRHDIPLGFVLADDPEEAEFQASKILLAHTRILSDDDAIVDTVNGFCGKPDDLMVARPERLGRVLASRWRLLAIGGHSDLGHMGLGSHVICGATGPERVAGQPPADGCDPGNGLCRCKTKFLRTAIPAASLRAVVVAMMGCSTFDLTAGEFPSTNSLCASMLGGQPAAVIGTLGQLDGGFDAVGPLASFVAEGFTLGAAVQRLNRSHQIPTGYGIALAGDPALRFPSRAPAAAADGQVHVAADCRDRAQPLLDRCQEMISRSRLADRIWRALLKVSETSMEPGLEDALEVLDRRCEQVQDAAWEGVRVLHWAVAFRRWYEPDRIMARLDQAVRRWDEAFIKAASLVGGNEMYAALHAFHRLNGAGAESSCARCGSRLESFYYSDPELADRSRVAAECWLCGPVQESAETGPHLAIAVSGMLVPSAQVQPRLSVRNLQGAQDPAGRLAVILNDRPSKQVLAAYHAECSLADLPALNLTIPADARTDLHVLWAVWVSDLMVAFAATRLPVIRVVQ
jgi:hypothetical protein